MKPLFTKEEFESASCYQVMQLECIQCGTTFNKTKKRIQDATRKNKNGACFCSSKCSSDFNKYPIKTGLSGRDCKKCNEPAIYYSRYSSGDFCSDFCSRSYSSNINKEQKILNIKKTWGTENRITLPRKPYVYKPRKVVPLEKRKFKKCMLSFCEGCLVVIKNKHRKFCINCMPFRQFVKFYQKLDVTGSNLIEKNENAVIYFKYLYNNLEKSKIDLAQEYGLNTNSIYLFCKNNNIQLRTVGEGLSIAFKNNKVQISNPCSNSFYNQQYHTGHTGQVFFCRSSYEVKLASKLDELKEYYEYEGISIPYQTSGETHYYLPDFYLPQHNLILEPKSNYFFQTKNKKFKAQYEAVIKLGIQLHYVFDKDIKKIVDYNSFDEFLNLFENRKYF